MTNSNDEQYFIDLSIECGAVEAKLISPSTVETGTWVHYKCQFGCLFYGKYLVCPPYTPDADEMRKILSEYNRAILFQIAPKTPEESKEIVAAMEKKLFLDNYHKVFGLGAGPCFLCPKCALDEGCRNPFVTRPSMEACGIDVYATVRKHGFKINVVRDYEDEQHYYGLMLID